MPKRSRAAAAALLCTALIATAGCRTAAKDWTAPLSPAWTADVQLLSDPKVLDDLVVAYTVGVDGAEEITAWRLDDGKVLWRQTVLPGTTPRGVQHHVAAIKHEGKWLVAALVPRDGRHEISDWSRFSVLDAETGATVYPQLHSTWFWGTRPSACNEQRAFCIDGFQYSDESYEVSRLTFAPDDLGLSVADFEDAPYLDDGMSIGGHLNVKDGNLRYGINGAIRWSRDYEDVFGPGAGTDAGWAWRELTDDEGALLIGMGGDASKHRELDYDKPFDAEISLGGDAVVALDPLDGTTVWQVENAEACPAEDAGLSVYDDVVVLCRFAAGTLSWHWDGTEASEITYSGVELEIFGVDVRSGKTLWQRPLDAVSANYAPARHEGRRFISTAGPMVILDGTAHHISPEDGRVARVDDNGVLLCTAPPAQVELTSIWKDPTYVTPAPLQLCDVENGVLEDGIVSRATLTAVGFAADQYAVLNFIDRLAVYPPSE